MNRIVKTTLLSAIAVGASAIAVLPASASGWATRVEGRRHTYDHSYGSGYGHGYGGYIEGQPYQGYGIPSYGYEQGATGPFGYGYGYDAY